LFLPDVNLWLALNFDSHVHHPAAKKWFDALSDQICFFCRMTQQSFLRLATNPAVFGKHAVTMAQAWQQYDTYLSDARISFASEPPGVEIIGAASRSISPFRPSCGTMPTWTLLPWLHSWK
jgi:toxin-antitoxin system PIN domain toxin